MADDSRIDRAIKRFEKAMAGLEIAAASGAKRMAGQQALEKELSDLRAARDELAGDLSRSAEEIKTLKSTNLAAASRIDKVVDNIKTVLVRPS